MGRETHIVKLESLASDSFHAIKAAQSVDLNIKHKLTHELKVDTDFPIEWNIGVIIGNSGSGKSTLAAKLFGFESFEPDPSKAIIDQFPDSWTYEQRAAALCGMGLSSIPCWIRPMRTLSTGQQARANAALKLEHAGTKTIVLDEWTSTVDRNIAMIMSERLSKFVRNNKKKVVICSCHFDILPWLRPDWVIDCNSQTYANKPNYEKKNFNSMFENAAVDHGTCLASIII